MTTRAAALDRFCSLVWPLTCVCGLLLVAFAQVNWGVSDEGVRPSITGLGRVTVPGASADDVDFFFGGQTRRPGLVVVIAGAMVALAALIGWWRKRARPVAMAIAGIGAVVAVAVAIRTLSDPARHLFSDRLNDALDLDLPRLQPGYGLLATLVVGVLIVLIALAWVVAVRINRNAESS